MDQFQNEVPKTDVEIGKKTMTNMNCIWIDTEWISFLTGIISIIFRPYTSLYRHIQTNTKIISMPTSFNADIQSKTYPEFNEVDLPDKLNYKNVGPKQFRGFHNIFGLYT